MTYQQGKNKKVRKPDTKRSKEKESVTLKN
jgi:hypothetical protein